ncbi:MAG: hypothetical protein K6F54_05760 [Lachnospiraceae bacterium]|nr:hypothetical protein [Lachnospiraceae bacterium]
MGGGNNLINILIQTVKARFTGLVTKLRLYTSWSFIKTRLIVKIREFFTNMLGVKPRDSEDYFTVGRWMISKRLFYAAVLIIGVISIWYISSETTIFKKFDEGGVRTYKYNSVRLRTAEGHVRITGRSGYLAYDGTVEDGAVTGSGTLYNPAGNIVYTGTFEQNKFEGSGTQNYEDGNMRYTGTFHENLFEGTGNLYREDGSIEYMGGFLQGMKSGDGILYDAGGNEIYNGTFAFDDIVYSELLGKSATEVGDHYKGHRTLYISGDESVVIMDAIGAIYHSVADAEALDDEEKVSEVYILQDYYKYGNDTIDSISEIRDIMGNPIYEGYSGIIFPEAVAVETINSNADIFKGVKDMEVSSAFSDVFEVDTYDDSFPVYIYSFKRGEIVYSFVCTSKDGNFEFYYLTRDEEGA